MPLVPIRGCPSLTTGGLNPAARRARYAALAAELDPDSALLTAHHHDDQAETLLLQLLRGAGPHGLAAMPAVSRLGQGWLLRPLLNVDRAELLAYAHDHDLQWIKRTPAIRTPVSTATISVTGFTAVAGTLACHEPNAGPFRPAVRRNRQLAR